MFFGDRIDRFFLEDWRAVANDPSSLSPTPYGLSLSLWAFTKILHHASAHLRRLGRTRALFFLPNLVRLLLAASRKNGDAAFAIFPIFRTRLVPSTGCWSLVCRHNTNLETPVGRLQRGWELQAGIDAAIFSALSGHWAADSNCAILLAREFEFKADWQSGHSASVGGWFRLVPCQNEKSPNSTKN